MKIIKPSVEMFGAVPTDYENTLRFIEMAGRTCYRSEDKITADSAEGFVRRLIKAGHLAMVEHSNFVVRFIAPIWPDFLELQGELGKYLNVHLANGELHVGGSLTAWMQRYDAYVDNEEPMDDGLFTPFFLAYGEIFGRFNEGHHTGWQICPHNEIPKELHRYSAKFITNRACCYDDKTKVLTDSGWKLFDELNKNDHFYTINDNNDIEKIKAINFVKEKYNGQIHYYKSTQISLGVTPNHNMWVLDYNKRSDKTRTWKFIQSKDLTNSRYKFSKSATPNNNHHQEDYIIPGVTIRENINLKKEYKSINLNSNLFFEFVGWWVSDGSISYGKNGSGSKLFISQTKLSGRIRVKELLELMQISHREEDDGFYINSPPLLKWLATNFLKDGDTRKTYYVRIPRWFFSELSASCLESFLNGVIGGDGTKHTNGPGSQIYTASEKFAEDLIELALNIGKCGNIYQIGERYRLFPNGHHSKCQKQFVVSIVSTNSPLFDKRRALKTEEKYDGYIYCVELPKYHKLYVMRDGKACWCGNSHEIVRHRPCSFAQESQRYVKYENGDMEFIEPAGWEDWSPSAREWFYHSCLESEKIYTVMRKEGLKAQDARHILPNATKTEIIVTADSAEYKHIKNLRTHSSADPNIQLVMNMMPWDKII